MKLIFNILFLLFAFNALAGVGGSVGGSGNRPTRNLDFYIDSNRYIPNIPEIDFVGEDYRIRLPINQVCFRDEENIESINEVLVTHNQGSKDSYVTREILYRSAKTIVKKTKYKWFKRYEIEEEFILPKVYEITILYSRIINDGEHTVATTLNYHIPDCE